MNKIVFSLVFVAAAAFASASCWNIQQYTGGWNTQSFWLCVNGAQHGWIYSESPAGYQYGGGRMFKVELQSFTYSGMYPATLNCYEQFTGIGRVGGGKGGMLNSVPPGPLYSWHLLQQVTLTGGQSTPMSSSWVLAGCPPVQNSNQQGGTPPQVLISTNWIGFGGNRATAIATPNYVAVGAPFYGYFGYVDALMGQTASAVKVKKARR